MKIISHRRNTVAELISTDPRYGVEIDIRSQGTKLHLEHEPFKIGVDFEEWLEHYRHELVILNVKEEGLESRVIELMKRHAIQEFFFLDQSFPFLIKTSRTGESRCAVRVSEFESIETALTLAGKVQWVWVDYFTRFPLTQPQAKALQNVGFKLCLVSPELQGRNPDTEIPQFVSILEQSSIKFDAVCTKRPDLWATLEQTP